MDEGTIKTPNPDVIFTGVLVWGGVAILNVLNLVRIQCVKLLQNMVYNTTQHPPTPAATHCLYILYVYFGKGGGVEEVREKVEGQQFTRGVEIPT